MTTSNKSEYNKKYYAKNKEREKARHKEYCKKKPEVIRAIQNKASAKWVSLNKDKKMAHTAINHALRDKKLFELPCFICGEKAEAHHHSYSLPLDVVWLCKKHHMEIHNNEI